MTKDRTALLAIAEGIAEAENRASQLRERVERLRNEGSDAAQAQETLQVVSRNLPISTSSRRFCVAQCGLGILPRRDRSLPRQPPHPRKERARALSAGHSLSQR